MFVWSLLKALLTLKRLKLQQNRDLIMIWLFAVLLKKRLLREYGLGLQNPEKTSVCCFGCGFI